MLYLYCYVKLKYNLSIILAALFFSCEDHEVEGQAKVQGSLLSLPLHAGSDRQGEGRQTHTPNFHKQFNGCMNRKHAETISDRHSYSLGGMITGTNYV